MDTPLTRIDAKIEELRARLVKLESLRETIEDPEMAAELAFVFEKKTASAVAPKAGVNKGNTRDLIRKFFTSHANEWVTITQISEGVAGRSLAAIKQNLYHLYPGDFERQKVRMPNGKVRTKFRLKTKE